jgi:hypothetical protein
MTTCAPWTRVMCFLPGRRPYVCLNEQFRSGVLERLFCRSDFVTVCPSINPVVLPAGPTRLSMVSLGGMYNHSISSTGPQRCAASPYYICPRLAGGKNTLDPIPAVLWRLFAVLPSSSSYVGVVSISRTLSQRYIDRRCTRKPLSSLPIEFGRVLSRGSHPSSLT